MGDTSWREMVGGIIRTHLNSRTGRALPLCSEAKGFRWDAFVDRRKGEKVELEEYRP